jgi:hypothetical protein
LFCNVKNIILSILLISSTFFLSACATQYHRGDGVIISEKKLKSKDYQPHGATKSGAIIGGSIGAIGGAAAGGFLGLVLGAFSGGTAPILIVTTLGGAAVGSLVIGAAGGTVGGGLGYAVDVTSPNAGTYQFVVQPNDQLKPVTITQYSSPIPINTEVHIIEKDNVTYIQQK